MSVERRDSLGAHYTPEPLARRLVRLAFARYEPARGQRYPIVCDPSCGAGSILLAAADELLSLGATPAEILGGHLVGCDIDAAAVGAARSALGQWARDSGETGPPEPRVLLGDALDLPPGMPEVDLVIGNPPFASPLSATVSPTSRDNHSGGAYVDDAAIHLGAAVAMVVPGGVVCLLQPQSVLGSRDATAIREEIGRAASLEMLWASDQELFTEASVQVCAPVLVRHRAVAPHSGADRGHGSSAGVPDPGTPGRAAVQWNDGPVIGVERVPGVSWAALLAVGMGIPAVQDDKCRDGRTSRVAVGDLARCTAGFRDEFYALAGAAYDSDNDPGGVPDPGSDPGSEGSMRAVTVGMIDPAVLRWGAASFRLAGRRFTAPRVDCGRLAAVSPQVARWALARAVPKVLVASQTKVIEAVVDNEGDCVGVTPVVSVEPLGECPPGALAAMLSAPSNSARLATSAAGTGRNPAVLRVGARSVAGLVAVRDPGVWNAAERLWEQFESLAGSRAAPPRWLALGRELDALLGDGDDDEIVSWWVGRLPRRIVGPS